MFDISTNVIRQFTQIRRNVVHGRRTKRTVGPTNRLDVRGRRIYLLNFYSSKNRIDVVVSTRVDEQLRTTSDQRQEDARRTDDER